jgi:hypothetical protein
MYWTYRVTKALTKKFRKPRQYVLLAKINNNRHFLSIEIVNKEMLEIQAYSIGTPDRIVKRCTIEASMLNLLMLIPAEVIFRFLGKAITFKHLIESTNVRLCYFFKRLAKKVKLRHFPCLRTYQTIRVTVEVTKQTHEYILLVCQNQL